MEGRTLVDVMVGWHAEECHDVGGTDSNSEK